MSLSFYQQLQQVLKKEDIVLATVIKTQGSVPREIGAKMIICADGRTFNTIGGGAGEAKIVQQAQIVLQTGIKQLVSVDLSGASHKQTEGVCGGLMEIWLERWSGKQSISLVEQIINSLESDQKVNLFTPFAGNQTPYVVTEATATLDSESGFSEVIQPPPTLMIIGAGHVGEQLAKVGSMLGFQMIIQDERPEWANRQRYPQARQIYNQPITTVLAKFTNHSQLYIAMVTRGYQYDLEAFQAISEHNISYCYLGMIGSLKRVKMVKKALSQSPSIYAPIGLDIGALTPEEIAISIGAELILMRRGGTGRPLSEALS